MVLIGLLQKQFFKNLQTEKFPSHMIISRKQDLLDIQEIDFNYLLSGVNLTPKSIDLSNLEILKLNGNIICDLIEINIEGLSSLKYLRLEFNSVEQITLKNLPKLRELNFFLKVNSPNNIEFLSRFTSELSECLPNIEALSLYSYLLNLNLDSLINLKYLRLAVYLMDDFNFDIFKHICNQLEEISIACPNIDDNSFAKLFHGNFPILHKLILTGTKITKLEKTSFDRFPMLHTLSVNGNRELRKIDDNAFSNLKHLITLSLTYNCIESIDKSHFSNLTKLEILLLSGNPLGNIQDYVFSDLKSLRYLGLNNIQLTSLDPKFLACLNNLEILSLKDNNLTNFDFGILANIGRTYKIDLSGNPIINKHITLYPLANGEKVLFKYT